jgi:hypothetical protein
MERKMFGHRLKKKPADTGRDPGRPYNMGDMDMSQGKAKDNPPGYEGKEHVKYKNPGFSRHNIRIPEDEPHMKSRVSKEESHEMEDNYHMGVPDQTEKTLEKRLKRAHMLMDAPNQQDPKPLRGNIVHDVGYDGEEDTSGEEEMGPNDMQEQDGPMPKEDRKKMIVAVMKRKMKSKKPAPEPEDEGEGEMRVKRKFGPKSSY